MNAAYFLLKTYLSAMDKKKAVAEKLLEIKAIRLSPQNPFTWASGWKSPIYCDNRKALSFPDARNFIKDSLCKEILATYPDAEWIAGVATAGIAWGALIADDLKLPYIYVRPKPKDHGLGNQIEGYYKQGKRVVVVEDLISTGKSSLQVVDVLKEAGLEVAGMVSIFTYGFEAATDAFQKAGVSLSSLTNYESLISLATENGTVSSDDQNTLLNWRKDPSAWGRNG